MSHNFVVDKYHLYRHAWIFDSSPDKETKLTEQQYSIMLANGGFMVRNTYDFDCNVATSFWYVIKDSYSGWNEFGKSTKNCINRAKRKLCFKIVDKECILKYGYDIIEDSYKHYKIKDRSMSKSDFISWIKYCNSEDYDFWGVFNDDDNLVGLSVNRKYGMFCGFDATYILHDYKKAEYSAFYGLFYVMIDYYLQQKGFSCVSDGSRSVSEHSNIQSYLIDKFKFRKAYCRLDVYYKWWFGIVVKILYPFRNVIPFVNVKAVLRLEEYNRQQKSMFESKIGSL